MSVFIVGQARPLDVNGMGGAGGGTRGAGGTGGPPPISLARAERNLNLAGSVAGGAGAVGAAEAGNNTLQGFSAAARTASTVLSSLGPKGALLGAGLTAATAGVTAFSSTVNAFVARGRELARVNSQVAGAVAVADANRYRSDIREGERLGPQLSRMIENQEKADAVFREIMLPIKGYVLEKLNMILEGILKGIADAIDGLNEVVNAVSPIGGRLAVLTNMAQAIRDILAGNRGGNELQGWLDGLANFRDPNAANAAPGVPRAPAPPAPGLGVPFGLFVPR